MSSIALALHRLDQIVATPAAEPPAHDGRPWVLYGAGKLGHMVAELCQLADQPIAYAIDRNPPANGRLLGHIEVIRPEEAPDADKLTHPLAISVVTAPFAPIALEMRAAGWQHATPAYDLLHALRQLTGLNNGWFAGPLDATDREAIAEVLAGWSDDHARSAHLQFLSWRVNRIEREFDDAPVTIDDRYFIPEVLAALRPDDVFVDGGAWHGEVIGAFASLRQQAFRSAVAIEPDRANLASLHETIAAMPPELRVRISVVPKALSDSSAPCRFDGGKGMSARIRPEAAEMIEATTLDALELMPGMLKLHLEGHELAALAGARETLLKARPVVAATVYHNRDGLWRTPQWLMRTLPDYRFLMRMHGWCGTGAVIYAIPAERWQS